MVEGVSRDRALLEPLRTEGASVGPERVEESQWPAPAVAVDDIDRKLIDLVVSEDGITNRELSQRMDISESAVSIRLRKLISSGVLIFTAVFDWEAVGFEWFVVCRAKTCGRPPREVADEVGRITQCDAAAVVLGGHDLLAYFLVKDRAELREVSDQLARIDGITEIDLDLCTQTRSNRKGHQLFMARNVPAIRLPAPRIELDDLDVSILQALVHDGRQSSRNIARMLDVSEGTVRTRIARLTQTGLLRVAAMVDPVGLGQARVIAAVSVRIDRTRVAAILNKLIQMPDVVFAAECIGTCDIHIAAVATDPRQLMDTVVAQVQSIEGVRATDSLFMVDVVRFSPYMTRIDPED